MYFGMIVTAYGYAYFSPAIIATYGYSPIETQLHSVAPWAAAFAFAMVIAYLSDKFRHRFAFQVIPILICIAGLAILMSLTPTNKAHRHTLYGALFLVAMGAYSAMPVIVGHFNMNLGGHHRRAIGTAWQVAFGNCGGIIAVFAFLAKDAPGYHTGYSISIAFACLSLVACCFYAAACWHQNRQRDRAVVDKSLTREEKSELGDLSPDYRYML